jgi:hypothetical protein
MQYVALASQNFTKPTLTGEEPDATVAVREIGVPTVTEFVGAEGVPDVIANVVLVVACDA